MNPILPLITIIIITILIILWYRKNNKSWILPKDPFPGEWRTFLMKEINFYNALTDQEKEQFEYKVQEFLLNCRITGIQTTIDDYDKLLVAASAVIPIFAFKNWKYINLDEVLIYPNTFNQHFETQGQNRSILGMVGTGYMKGKMILTKQALELGFKNETDKKNTAIHEFVHLIDMADGVTDGLPSVLLGKQYVLPWLDMINKKIDEIFEGKSDINPYGSTNRAEFFSVVSEYFFERPKLLEKNHPKLYELLEKIFNQDMSEKILKKNTSRIRRNSPCPCNSGKKFKKCCGRIHYS